VYYYVRHPQADVVRSLYERLVLCARAGALATETKLEIDFQGGIYPILPNNVLASVTMDNLRTLNDLEYTPEENKFALRIRQTLWKPSPLDSIHEVNDVAGTIGKGSTDVGDVSWKVPTNGFSTACWVPGTWGHSWQAVAAGGTSIGRKGMNLAARVLAASAWDFYQNPTLIEQAKEEHARRLGENKYETLMQPGQKPPLNYRNPPGRSEVGRE
jgi:aminobenzoyl-glutamate utilization protein B